MVFLIGAPHFQCQNYVLYLYLGRCLVSFVFVNVFAGCVFVFVNVFGGCVPRFSGCVYVFVNVFVGVLECW